MTDLLMDETPKKTSKGRLSVVLVAVIVAGTCLVAGIFLFGVFGKTEWQEVQVSPYAQNVQTRISNNGATKTTTYMVNMDSISTNQELIMSMGRQGWDTIFGNALVDDHYTYIDRTKNFSIFSLEYKNDCAAFFLNPKVESISDKITKVTLVQTAGPCGKPLS